VKRVLGRLSRGVKLRVKKQQKPGGGGGKQPNKKTQMSQQREKKSGSCGENMAARGPRNSTTGPTKREMFRGGPRLSGAEVKEQTAKKKNGEGQEKKNPTSPQGLQRVEGEKPPWPDKQTGGGGVKCRQA